MPIYTKKGDKGETALPGKRRLKKTEPLIEALGALDSANAAVGLAVSCVKNEQPLIKQLQQIQKNFLEIGACLVLEQPEEAVILKTLSRETKELEQQIDSWEEKLPKLQNFILPGGAEAAAALHLARALTREAERRFHRLNLRPTPISQYLNRLSDYLFQAARHSNTRAKVEEIIWQSGDHRSRS